MKARSSDIFQSSLIEENGMATKAYEGGHDRHHEETELL